MAASRRQNPCGQSEGTPRLRVLSYNIHQGLTIHRRQIAISILKEAILSLRADLVLLQEVAGRAEGETESGEEGLTAHQLEELADEIWPYHAYGRNAVFTGGFHGNAILSRYPIRNAQHIDITVKPLDRRGMLHGQLEVPGCPRPVHVIALHLGLLQYERHRQIRQVCQVLRDQATGAPCLMGGDFNDWREKASRGLRKRAHLNEAFLTQYSRHARTFPSRFPVLRLDRIYYRGIHLELATRLKGRPWFYLSDHLPLMADFRIA